MQHKYPLIVGFMLLLGCASPSPSITQMPPSDPARLVAIAVENTRVHLERPQQGIILMERAHEADYGPMVAHTIEGAFTNSGRYDVVERKNLDSLKNEIALSQDDVWFNQNDVAQPGNFRGARFLILSEANLRFGSIMGTSLFVQIRIANVTNGRIVQQYRASGYSISPNMNIALDKCLVSVGESLAKQIANRMPPA